MSENDDLHRGSAWRRAVLVLPRLRIQNANAVSSAMTWGFPSMTALLGLTTALERKLGRGRAIKFYGVGVVCHAFEPQVTTNGFTRSFRLTRNPVQADGSTAAIVEEGRVHLELTLVFDVELAEDQYDKAERESLAQRIDSLVQGMRVAGGSVVPPLSGGRRLPRPSLRLVTTGNVQDEQDQFRRLMRRCLPGFALVARDDLLQARLRRLRDADAQATAFDAWLDLSRLTSRSHEVSDGTAETAAEWRYDGREGWTVPIPVGFAALSELHPAGSVAGARDAATPLRFVEGIYSVGQWISPHRLRGLSDLFWYGHYQDGCYRCRNDYVPSPAAAEAASVED